MARMFSTTAQPRRRSAALRAIIAASLIAAMSGPASAVGGAPGSPDWPCPQRKVLKLSASDLQWEGDLPDATGWRQEPGLGKLVEQLASRRTSQEDAAAAIKAYAASVPEGERRAKLGRLFAGLLETVNLYRSSVIDGIERFNRRQKGRAKEIEAEGIALTDLKRKGETDPAAAAEYEKALELYDWNVRVFEERRQNLPLACDIPPAIDGRTFEIVREIRAALPAAR